MRHPPARAARPLALLIAGLIAGCSSATAPAFPDNDPPTSFSVSYWAWARGMADVTLHGDTLVAVRGNDVQPGLTTTVRRVPTSADWEEFWRAADGAGLRRWPSQCRNAAIMDGAAFTVDIIYAGGRVHSTGANAYPRRDGRCTTDGQRSDELGALLDAVSELVGQPYPW